MFDASLSWGLLPKHPMTVRFIAQTLIHVMSKEFFILRQKHRDLSSKTSPVAKSDVRQCCNCKLQSVRSIRDSYFSSLEAFTPKWAHQLLNRKNKLQRMSAGKRLLWREAAEKKIHKKVKWPEKSYHANRGSFCKNFPDCSLSTTKTFTFASLWPQLFLNPG